MKTLFAVFIATTMLLTGCAVKQEAPVQSKSFSIKGKWVNKRLKHKIDMDSTLISSTSSSRNLFLIKVDADQKMQAGLNKEEITELISSLDLVPQTLAAVGPTDALIRPLFEATRNPLQRLIVAFYKQKTDRGAVVCTFKIRDPKIPNSMFVGFFVLTPEKAAEWKEQLAKLIQG